MSTLYREAELLALLKQLSFRTGNFTLASGKQSSFYLDCRLTTLDAQGSYLLGQLLYERIKPLHVDAVGGMALGAVPLVSGVLYQSALEGRALSGFVVRKEVKGHGTARQIEGHLRPWMRIALVEDVATTGGSTIQAIELIRKTYPQIDIAKVIAIVDRKAGAPERFQALGVPFEALYSIDAFL